MPTHVGTPLLAPNYMSPGSRPVIIRPSPKSGLEHRSLAAYLRPILSSPPIIVLQNMDPVPPSSPSSPSTALPQVTMSLHPIDTTESHCLLHVVRRPCLLHRRRSHGVFRVRAPGRT